MRETLLFARTKKETEIVFDGVAALAVDLSILLSVQLAIMLLGADEITWDNGFVVKFLSDEKLSDICDRLKSGPNRCLSRLEAWSMIRVNHNSFEYIESPANGRLSDCHWIIGNKPVSTLFLISKEGEEHKIKGIVEDIREKMRKTISYQVFDFIGGAILIFSPYDASIDNSGATQSDIHSKSVWISVRDAWRSLRSADGDFEGRD
jgi:hypothetical protein